MTGKIIFQFSSALNGNWCQQLSLYQWMSIFTLQCKGAHQGTLAKLVNLYVIELISIVAHVHIP